MQSPQMCNVPGTAVSATIPCATAILAVPPSP